MNFQWNWLSASNLKKETEGFIFACQDQAVPTNLEFFSSLGLLIVRLCGSQQETVDHLLTSCSVIAQSFYKKRHDAVAKLVHWELAKKGGFEINDKWWEHCPLPVLHNNSMKLLWDFTVQTDKHLTHNRPDIICLDFTMNCCFLLMLLYQEIVEFPKRFLKNGNAIVT